MPGKMIFFRAFKKKFEYYNTVVLLDTNCAPAGNCAILLSIREFHAEG